MHSDEFVLKCVASYFLQTSCCLVGSPRELYLRVHKNIINLTCMLFQCISKLFFHDNKSPRRKNVMYWAPPSWINEIYLSHFPIASDTYLCLPAAISCLNESFPQPFFNLFMLISNNFILNVICIYIQCTIRVE